MKLTYLLIADCQSRSLPETQNQNPEPRAKWKEPEIQEEQGVEQQMPPDTRVRLVATNVVRPRYLDASVQAKAASSQTVTSWGQDDGEFRP